MTHQELCDRAAIWLRSNRRCFPILVGNASCEEVPDAIGWSSSHRHYGSIVVECKTSVADFRADADKYMRWEATDGHVRRKNGFSTELLKKAGYQQVGVPRMGNYRFYICLGNIITPSMIESEAPDHGLLNIEARKLKVVIEAPLRNGVNYPAEIRLLRMALLHVKDNLLALGCEIDLQRLAKFGRIGRGGIKFPGVEKDFQLTAK